MNLTAKIKRAQIRAGIFIVKSALDKQLPKEQTAQKVFFVLETKNPEFIQIKVTTNTGSEFEKREQTKNSLYDIKSILSDVNVLFDDSNFQEIELICGKIDFSENTFNLTACGISKNGLQIKTEKNIL